MDSSNPQKLGDTTATIAQLKELVDRFVQERDWSHFHQPKNLAMSIAIEAAELMEHFQWTNPVSPPEGLSPDSPIAQELSDVIAYCLAMANVLQLDISQALEIKMGLNRAKYPVGAEYRPKGFDVS